MLENKNKIIEIATTATAGLLILLGLASDWYLPVSWDVLIITFFLSVFVWGLIRRWRSLPFYYLSVFFFFITAFFDLIGENSLAEYASILLFLFIIAGLTNEALRD